jgi:hypothetical protein
MHPTASAATPHSRPLASTAAIAIVALVCCAHPATAATIIPDSTGAAILDTIASVDTTRSLGATLRDDLDAVLEDALAYFTAPARFGLAEWGALAGVAGGSVGLMALDETLRRDVRDGSYSQDASTVLTRGSDFGEIAYANILTGATYLTGLIAGSDDIRITGRLLGEGLLLSGVVTMSLRYVFGRERPYRADGAWDFEMLQTSNEIQSFPSGHTTVAFTVASVLSDRIAHPAATAVLYSAATLTGLSRIYLDRHWTSDVFLGAAIGTVTGIFLSRREDARSEPAPASGTGELQVVPTWNGFAVMYRF